MERHLTPGARLHIEELPRVAHPGEALVDALVSVVEPGEEATVELAHIEIESRGRTATVVVDARLGGDVGRDLHAEHRQLVLQLSRTEDEWRIVAADVPARKQDEPEPRP